MTVIPKKRKFNRPPEEEIKGISDYGQKYHCDNCQKDISNLVRISCHECKDFDLCVECFCSGAEPRDHKKTHAYRVMDLLDFPIFEESWGADEELLLIEGLEIFGMGNWEQISEHIGSKNRVECYDHYMKCYIQSDSWPLPDMSKTFNSRRSQLGKVSSKGKPLPKVPRPPASAPTNHEIAGFMPGRLEFETEYDNDAEHLCKDMVFEDKEDENDVALKVAVLDIYNTALNRRAERKKFIFASDCLEFKKIQAIEKRRSPEEKELLKRTRVFAQLQTHQDFQKLTSGLLTEIRSRQRISQLQEYRKMGITTFKDAADYDRDKAARIQNKGQTLSVDRSVSRSRQARTSSIFGDDFITPGYSRASTPSKTGSNPHSLLTTPAALQPQDTQHTPSTVNTLNIPPPSANTPTSTTATSATAMATTSTGRKPAQPLDIRGTDAYDLLLPAEQNLCSTLRILPRAYLVIKETLLSEYEKRKGNLRRREARTLVKIDVNKTGKIFDFFLEMGWLKSHDELK